MVRQFTAYVCSTAYTALTAIYSTSTLFTVFACPLFRAVAWFRWLLIAVSSQEKGQLQKNNTDTNQRVYVTAVFFWWSIKFLIGTVFSVIWHFLSMIQHDSAILSIA